MPAPSSPDRPNTSVDPDLIAASVDGGLDWEKREETSQLSLMQGWALALTLGLLGFVVNGFTVRFGWGLDFLVGGIFAYSALRVLTPVQIVVAASLAASRTFWLWEHPWAWLVWTVEAAVLASLSKKSSPVRHDLLFWLLGGAPLLALTYGQMMDMDRSSLMLVILKHSVNGVLNVTIGELVYTGVLLGWGQRARKPLPAVTLDSAILAGMIAISVLPVVHWLRIDAPHRERWIQTLTQARLTEDYQEIERKLWAWRTERTALLAQAAHDPDAPAGRAPVAALHNLHPDFTQTQVMETVGQWLRPDAAPGQQSRGAHYGPLPNETLREPHLLYEQGTTADGHPRLALAVPVANLPQGHYMVAALRDGALERVIKPSARTDPGLTCILLIGPAGQIGAHIGAPEEPWLLDAARNAPDTGAAVEVHKPRDFGTSPMNASRDVAYVVARTERAFPGWKIALVSRARNAILEERESQIRIMLLLAGLIGVLTLMASVLAERSRTMLARMTQALTDLAMMGGENEQIRRAMISEFGAISSKITLAGSEMARQRQDLITSRRRLEVIVEHAGLVIYSINARDRTRPDLTFITENIAALVGYTAAEVSAKGWLAAHVHPDDANQPPLLDPNLRAGSVLTREYRLRHKLGHYVWVHDCLAVDETPDGVAGDAVGFLLDSSERRSTTEKLIQASKMESLGRMAAGIAHELNQPLNFISLASQNLYRRFASGNIDPPYAAEKIERILSQVRRAALIVGQVRTFGRSVTEPAEVIAIRDVIEDVALLLKGQLDLKHITLDSDNVDKAAMARVHPVRLGQVLINLVINARDSIVQRRTTEPDPPGHIRITVQQVPAQADRTSRVEISVEDDGTGIAPEQLPLLFEPFFTTKGPQEGTGLGLSVSYGIIAEVGGTIRAENAGRGARFIISLPAVSSDLTQTAA